jgi:hypothetical protein
LNRSRNEAQRVLQEASQLRRISRFDNRMSSLWSQIERELDVISDAYNMGYNSGGYRNDRNRNNDWWRRIPFPN